MADTGNKAGQQVEVALQLKQNGSALSYANKTAFTAAGWDLIYRAAQVTQSITYTIQPHTTTALANEGWHLVVITAINGQGPIIVQKPSTGTGWQWAPPQWQAAYETNDIDDINTKILQSNGVTISGTNVTETDFELVEGRSWSEEITVAEAAVAEWGYTNDNLDDGTFTLTGEIRAPDNRGGQGSPDAVPNAYLSIAPTTAAAGQAAVLRLSLPEYPVAVTGVIEGMELASGDADDGPDTFYWEVKAELTKSLSITAVSTGSETMTVSGDQRKWFMVGQTITVSGSTGNDGDYVISKIAYSTNTTITVTGDITDATVDGTVDVDLSIQLARGIMTVRRQEARN